ncbi:MAG: GNAT family N-acetyltransferase [Saccharofermentanales bacterium]
MISYRIATIADRDILVKIRVDLLFEFHNISTEEEKAQLLINNKIFLDESLSNGSFVAWVAEDDGEIIATSGISFYTLPPNGKCPTGKVAYISNMCTFPEYRNRGIATKLFALSVDEAKKRGCSKVLLNATDMGRPIYEKYGFKNTTNDMVYYVV